MRRYILKAMGKAALLLLLFQILCIKSIISDKSFFMEKGENPEMEHVYMRRAPFNSTELSQCPVGDCGNVNIRFSATAFATSCVTLFCYVVNLNTTDSMSSFDLLGVNYDGGNFNADFKSELLPFGRVSCLNTQAKYTDNTYCFKLDGYYALETSKIIVNMGTYSCSKIVSVPGQRRDCALDCILDTNFANADCQPCAANCPAQNTASTVQDIQTCTLRVLQTPNAIGKPCTPVTTRTCTKTCSIDCTMTGPLWEECKANCASPTVSQIGYYSVLVSAQNGGASCNVPTPTTTSCSMPTNDLFSKCARNCEVAGNPTPACGDVCRPGDSTVIYGYSYTQTVVTPTYGGAPCPSGTTSCTCKSCELQPFPTSTGECLAQCPRFDGSTVTGVKLFEFPISKTGIATPCVTTGYRTCYSSCPCVFTSASSIGQCTVILTMSSKVPWVGYGIQKLSIMGSLPNCYKTTDLPCTTTYTPVDCLRTMNCNGCSCPWNGTPYFTSTTRACAPNKVRDASYGGKPCPTDVLTQTCSLQCPGCTYGPGVCTCDFTSLTKVATGTTVIYGTSKCIHPPSLSHSNCLTTTTGYPKLSCSSTISTPICMPAFMGCDQACTPSSTCTNKTPFMRLGYRPCYFSDTRAVQSKPITCTSSSFYPLPCSETLTASNCKVDYMCPTSTIACPQASTTNYLAQTLTCTITTLKPAVFGGSCISPSVSQSVITKTCKPTQTPTCLEGLTAYNVIIFGSARGMDSFITGRAAIGGNASLSNYEIGRGVINGMDLCNLTPSSALVIGGDLSMQGTIMNGATHVNGTCTNTITSVCPIRCNLCVECHCDPHFAFPLNLTAAYLQVKARAAEFSKMASTVTASIGVQDNQTISFTFSGKLFEVLNFPTGQTANWWVFNNSPATLATVIINIAGANVSLVGLNWNILKPNAVILNLYQAKRVTIDAMDVPATILAPDAIFVGTGTVKGSLFAAELNYVTKSPKFINDPFIGFCRPLF